MKKKFQNNKYFLIAILGIIFISLGIIYMLKPTNQIVDEVFQISQESDKIRLKSIEKLSDAKGVQQTYSVKVKNISKNTEYYRLRLASLNLTNLLKEDVKIQVTCNKEVILSTTTLDQLGNLGILVRNRSLEPGKEDEFEIALWIKEDSSDISKDAKLEASIELEKVSWKEEMESDEEAPTIMLMGDMRISLLKGSTFEDPGIDTIIDNVDGEISKDQATITYYRFEDGAKKVIDRIDTNEVGIYYIEYAVSDNAGNESYILRIVQVFETEEELNKILDEMTLEVSYSSTDIASTDVTVQIFSNKDLMPLEGWILSEDKRTLMRVFDNNITEAYLVLSEDGNSEIVQVHITNIVDSLEEEPAPPSEEIVDGLQVGISVLEKTASSVRLQASVSDESRVKSYSYLCGFRWSNEVNTNTYTCDQLDVNTTQNFAVRVIDRITGATFVSDTIQAELPMVSEPLISVNTEDLAKKKTVTITYADIAKSTKEYRIDSGNWITATTVTTFELDRNAEIEARILIGNQVLSTTYYEQMIDNSAPVVSGSLVFSKNESGPFLSWNAATDDRTESLLLKYYICYSKSNDITIDNCISNYLKHSAVELRNYSLNGFDNDSYVGVVVEDQVGNRSLYPVYHYIVQ